MKKKQKNQKYIAVKNGKPPKFPLPKKDLKLETINKILLTFMPIYRVEKTGGKRGENDKKK